MSDLVYSCRYENSRGDVLHLDEAPYLVRQSGLFDYQWNLTAYDRAAADGGRVLFARRAMQDKTLVLDVFADSQTAHNAALNRLHDVMEYDICHLTPGKLYVNGQYIRCFAYTSVKTLDRDWTTYTVVGLTLKVVSPAWTTEQTVTLLPSTADETDAAAKRYSGHYPYRYTEQDACRWVNDTLAPCPMRIKMFGACSSPSVYIGGREYAVNADIAEGEYVVIDQTDKTITHVGKNGVTSNIFGRRKKSVDNFSYAPAGNLEIFCSGPFACEITFFIQRSEAQWI